METANATKVDEYTEVFELNHDDLVAIAKAVIAQARKDVEEFVEDCDRDTTLRYREVRNGRTYTNADFEMETVLPDGAKVEVTFGLDINVCVESHYESGDWHSEVNCYGPGGCVYERDWDEPRITPDYIKVDWPDKRYLSRELGENDPIGLDALIQELDV